MSLFQALAPEFLLIAIGFVLARVVGWRADFWSVIERLTYWVLFPTLLFYANARTRVDLAAAAPLLGTTLVLLIVGAVLAFAGRALFKPDARVFAATFQCAFRFNAYIAFALAQRLHGDEGLAAMSIVAGITVPIVNVMAVWALVKGRGARDVVREIALNPLILACLAGVAYGAAGFTLAEPVATLCSRFGQAALVLGLLAVGAALRFDAAGLRGPFVPYLLAVKLVAIPLVALGLVQLAPLGPTAAAILVIFAASPLPSSAYVLAARLGGPGDVVAFAVTASIVASVFTIPLWLGVAL